MTVYPGPSVDTGATYTGPLQFAQRDTGGGTWKGLGGGQTYTNSQHDPYSYATYTPVQATIFGIRGWPRAYTITDNLGGASPYVWEGRVGTGDAFSDGIRAYEPSTEMSANASAVGWEFDGVQYLDGPRCFAAGIGDDWTAWSGAGQTAYNAYVLHSRVGPLVDGRLDVTVKELSRNSVDGVPAPFSASVLVGGASSYVVQSNATGPRPTEYADRVYLPFVLDAMTGTVIAPTEPWTANQDFTMPLPPAVTVTGYGSVRVPTMRMVDLPATSYPPTAPTAWTVFLGFTFGAGQGTAVRQAFRLLYATPQGGAVPRRQVGRTDGLLGAPRQVGGRVVRQVQRVY